MMKKEEVSLEDIKQGYQKEEQGYQCLHCDAFFHQEEIYQRQGHFLTAAGAIKHHVNEEHGGAFSKLLALDKKETTLTEVQKKLFRYIKEGKSDKEIANLTNTSASTIRHQRFVFKEKAKQAKLYLALYELAMQDSDDDFLSIPKGAKQVDERYITTHSEEEQILKTVFTSLSPLKLKQFPAKEKKKIVVLRTITEGLQVGEHYSEKQINAYLKEIYDDFVTIRRYLIEYGFLDRTKDGKAYWVKTKK